MSNKQQTALDIVIVQLKEEIVKSAHKDASTIRTGDYRIGLTKAIEFCDQAKQMEKEKIINAWENERQVVFLDSFEDTLSEDTIKELAEQYYNETYGGIK
jgi:hypothetical protein